ncbi:MAG TPA: hypothetical protein VG295_05520 [Solirubrobacteraceae bacterium]|nr:hypothetical protein [Solirubrobacteraceae bacterium]
MLEHAPAAARAAASLRGHREAAAQWARALRAAGALPPEELAPMYEARSYECYVIDDVVEAVSARDRALELRRALGDRRGVGDDLRWLSRLWWLSGDRERAGRFGAEAIDELEQLPPGRELAMAYSNRSALAMLSGEDFAAIAWGERAIDLARRLDDEETLAHALNNVGTSQLDLGLEADGGPRSSGASSWRAPAAPRTTSCALSSTWVLTPPPPALPAWPRTTSSGGSAIASSTISTPPSCTCSAGGPAPISISGTGAPRRKPRSRF